MRSATAKSRAKARESTNTYRARMRKAGLRLVQMWLPDTRAPGFRAECERQVVAMHKSPRGRKLEREIMGWAENACDIDGWTA